MSRARGNRTGSQSGRGGGPRDWLYLAMAAAAGTALVFTGIPWLVPLVQASLAFPVLWRDLRNADLWGASRRMLLWALFISAFVIALTYRFPQAVEAGVLRGAAYRDEMFSWIRTGIGAEGTPRQFIPQHLLHYGLTLALSLITAGLAGLLLGSVLLNYMNFYVGSLLASGDQPWLGLLFGWPLWSILRVIGFVFGAIAAAHLLTGRILPLFPWRPLQARRLILWSVALVLADIVVKALLAHPWRRILVEALGSG